MTDKKQIAGIALLGAVGLTAQADAAPIEAQQQDSEIVVGETAEATLEEVILASGLHQQHSMRIDDMLFGKGYERQVIKSPKASTIEEVVLASGLHQQATAMTQVHQGAFDEITTAYKLQPQDIDIVIEDPKASVLEEILLASGLHQGKNNVALYNVNSSTLEEIVLASGLHQQAKVFIYDDITTPAIEEIVLASGLHQQYEAGAPRTIVLDDPETPRYDYAVFNIIDVCW